MEEPLDFFVGLSPEAALKSSRLEISSTIAWLRQPSACNSAPRRCISRNNIFPELSIKLTPQRLMMYFCFGEAAQSSRQHCSTVATEAPAMRPSIVRTVLVRFVSVVILSMATFLVAQCEARNGPMDLGLRLHITL